MEQEILDEKIEDQDREDLLVEKILEDPDFLTMDQVLEANDQDMTPGPSQVQTQTKVIVHTVWVLYGISKIVKLFKSGNYLKHTCIFRCISQ